MSDTDLQVGGGYAYQWECAILLALNYCFEPARYNPTLYELIIGFLGQVSEICLEGEDRERGVDLEDINLSHEGRRVLVQVKGRQAAGERWTPSDPLLLKALYRFYDSQFLVEQPDSTRFVFLTNRPFNPDLTKLRTAIHACEGTLDLHAETENLIERLYERLARYAQKEKGATPDGERFRQMLARTALVEYLDVDEVRANIQAKLQAYGRPDWEQAHARLFAEFAHQSTRAGGGVVTPASIVEVLGAPAWGGPLLRVAGPKPACPYLGMKPFEEEDKDLFFGRDREVTRLIRRLRRHPFLAVIGPSGSGKSSLVSAGLVPALRESGLFAAGGWYVVRLRPQETPLVNLRDALGAGEGNLERIVADLLAAKTDVDRMLLVVDPFEEVFTQAREVEEAEAFQQALIRLAGVRGCYVVIAVRADFYPRLMASPLWSEIKAHREEVLNLGKEGLRQAIIRPAERVGVFVEPVLAERLVAEAAGGPGILPFVQETLVLLWDRMERRTLSLSAYDDLVAFARVHQVPGGEPMTGLQVAVAEHAEATLQALPEEQQVIARRIFLRLVKFGEGEADTRRQQAVEALRAAGDDAAEFEATVEWLAANRLLTLSGEERGGERRADISHEALIQGWPRLAGWIEERRSAGVGRRRLEEKAAEWIRLGRGSGGLLDEVELAEADRWLGSPDAAELGSSADLHELVQASRSALETAAREKEEAQQRELKQALALMEESEARRVAEEARARDAEAARQREVKRARLVAVGATIFTLALLALTILAEFQARAAQQQERLALAGQLAAQSQVVAEELPQRRLLLALEAVGALKAGDPRVMASEQALHDALDQMGGEPLAGSENYGSSIMAFSPGGRWLATAGGWTTVVRLWDLATDGPAAVPSELRGHIEQITSMAFSPDGRWLATGSYDGTVRLWDLEAGDPADEPLVLPDRANRVVSVAFSPDGQWLATGNSRGIARLWDLQAEDPTAGARVLHLEYGVTPVGFSPDGRWLATGGTYDTARLWDLDAQEPEAGARVLQGDEGNVTSVASSPGGRWLATGSDKGSWVWDLESSDSSARPLVLRQEIGVTSLAFSRDEQWLATGAEDGTARVWKLSAGPLRIMKELPGHEDSVRCVAFSPDARWLATGSDDGTARVWDLESADPGAGVRVLRGHDGSVTSVAFVRDGQWLATSNVGGPIRLWDLEAQHLAAEPQVLGSDEWNVSSVAFNSNGQWLATLSNGHGAWVWDLQAEDPAAERRLVPGDPNGVVSVAFSPTDRQRLATGSKDGTVRLWDLGTGESGVPAQVLPGHDGDVCSVAFSGDGRLLATGAEDGTARIWNLEAEAPTVPAQVLPRDNRSACALALSPDAHWLATANDKAVWVWDLKSSDPAAGQRVLRGHEKSVTSVAFSPDGRWLATGSYDGTARLWDLKIDDVAAGQRVLQTGDPTAEQWELPAVLSVAFDPDGRWLATGSRDGTVRLWDVRAKGPIAMALVLHGPESSAASVAYSPDGRWLAAGYDTAWLWRVSKDDLVATACRLAGRNLSQKEWDHYFEGKEYSPTCEGLPIHSTVIYASLDKAAALVRAGDVDGALASFPRAVQLDPNQEISAFNWAEICRIGSMWDRAADVLDACEQAVDLRPEYGSYREHRGLARALTGDYAGAIEDFRRFVEWARLQGYDEHFVSSREAWIAELDDGRNPFDQATLDALWYDWIR